MNARCHRAIDGWNVKCNSQFPTVPAIVMLRRLLCGRLVAALPASFADSQSGLGVAQRASFGSASSLHGLPGKAAQPCVSLIHVAGTLPRDLRAPGACLDICIRSCTPYC